MIKLHLGCGHRNFGKDWVHIDGGNYPHLDSHDIICLPYENKTVNLIYASHVLEYFDREQAFALLGIWKDKLVDGGILRLAVPDFRMIARLYMENIYDLEDFLGPLYGKMEMGNNFIYHKTAYDFLSLTELLFDVGFKEADKYDWRTTEHCHLDDHSQAYLPHMDKVNGTLISLNVEAIK